MNTGRKLLRIVLGLGLVSFGLPLFPGTALAASCPPSGAIWSNNAQFTGEPDGSDYAANPLDLNNNQWNMQPTSKQTMYLMTVGGTFGLCGVYQPASPAGVKSFPSINDSFSNNLYHLSAYSAITFAYSETNFPGTSVGDYQFMTDVFVNDTPGHSDAVEAEIITYRHESGSPSGTLVGSTALGGNTYDIYKNTALVDGHTYYAFVIRNNVTSGTADILGALTWLENNEGLSSSVPLINASTGWEIADIQSSTGGIVGGPTVSSFSTFVTRFLR